MAAIMVLACGSLGFVSAVAALAFFDASLLQALALWTATGMCGTLMGLAPNLLPRRKAARAPMPERA